MQRGLLLCFNRAQAERIMNEVHGKVCGPHMSGPMLAKKILHIGHYWLTLEADCNEHVKKCYQCQVHASSLHAPLNVLHYMTTPCPSPCGE